MAGQPEDMREGIRFLDETPEPPRPAAPAKPPKRKREWPVGLMAFLAVVGGGLLWKAGHDDHATTRDVFEERFEVGEAPRIQVEAIRGSVRVSRGPGRAVTCRVEVEGRGPTREEARRAVGILRPWMSSGPDGVTVRVGGVESPGRPPGRVKIRLEVPGDAQLRVVTAEGSVRVEEVRGSIAARTGHGKIEVEGASGPLVLDAKDGSIDCEARDALLLATTSNGSIRFEGSLAPGASRLVTRNGSVRVELPEHGRYAIDAQAGNGSVESDFPIVAGRADAGVIPVGFLDGGPEARLEIRTLNGSIRVEKD